jgi:hypothetical protein
MKIRYHIPVRAAWHVELPPEERTRLERAIMIAIERAVKSKAEQDSEIVATGIQGPEDSSELFEFSRYRSDAGTYAIPSYQKQGPTVQVPVVSFKPEAPSQWLLQAESKGPEGRGPNDEKLVDPFNQFLKEALRTARRNPPPPPPPPPTVPGELAQQFDVVHLSGNALWDRPDVQQRMQNLAADTEAREAANHPGVKVVHTTVSMMNYWQDRFVSSVEYILSQRTSRKDPDNPKQNVSVREQLRKELAREESKLAQSFQGDELVAQVEALRGQFRQRWAVEVERAVDGFVRLAENESLLITRKNPPKPAAVFGLPLGLEKERTADSAPGQVAKQSRPVADSVVRFMEAVQTESKTQAKADNYLDHEKFSPHFDSSSIGKYSFDVSLPFNKDPDTGFYDRAKTIEFFKAVERAAEKTNIEWVAFYNDAEVVLAVNDSLGKGRIAFSGGGGRGTYHHGPDPYLLHVHINIMPVDLANKYLVGAALTQAIKKLEDFWQQVNARF